jgi:hypothetical protein
MKIKSVPENTHNAYLKGKDCDPVHERPTDTDLSVQNEPNQALVTTKSSKEQPSQHFLFFNDYSRQIRLNWVIFVFCSKFD